MPLHEDFWAGDEMLPEGHEDVPEPRLRFRILKNREGAKAANFSMAYGMGTNKGIDWTAGGGMRSGAVSSPTGRKSMPNLQNIPVKRKVAANVVMPGTGEVKQIMMDADLYDEIAKRSGHAPA